MSVNINLGGNTLLPSRAQTVWRACLEERKHISYFALPFINFLMSVLSNLLFYRFTQIEGLHFTPF